MFRKIAENPMNIDEATIYVVNYYIPSGGGGAYKSEGFYCKDEQIWKKFINNCGLHNVITPSICRISSFYEPIEENQNISCCCIS